MICCSTNTPALRRYRIRFVVATCFYLLFLVPAVWVFTHSHPTGWLAYALAVLPALPILAMQIVVGLYFKEEKDELLRTILIQSLLLAIGATLSLTTIWGFLENFVQVKHLDLYLVFPIFWAFVGFFSSMVNARYR
jgi:4-amino-4-deoxy-L-arabinose transferase-like glycosyltransferase